MTRDDYKAYLKTEHWRKTRRRAFVALGKRCSKCGSWGDNFNPLQVHHKTYARLGEENTEDLQILCKRCHSGAHSFERETRCRLCGDRVGHTDPSFDLCQACAEDLECDRVKGFAR